MAPAAGRIETPLLAPAVAPSTPRAALPLALRRALCALGLALADLAGAAASVGLAWLARTALADSLGELTYVSWLEATLFLFAPLSVGFLLRGLYHRREAFWETVRLVAGTALAAAALTATALYLLRIGQNTSRSLFLLSAALLVALHPWIRLLMIRLLHGMGLWARRAAILRPADGTPLPKIDADYALGYRVVATASIEEASRLPSVDEVVVVQGGTPPERLAELASELHGRVRDVTVIPNLGGMAFGVAGSRFLFDERAVLLTSRDLLRERGNRLVKRAFDLNVSILLLLPLLPFMALISFAIFVTSGASPFFAQPRVGRRGRPFPCLKFRTMVRDAGERLAGLLEDPARREEWERYRKFRNDPRVTWLGRILRSTSLDELPQLFNVVAGHMSLVGPRPYLVEELGRLGPDADMILSIRPGMTGLWQVSGRRERTFEERLELEAWYVMNWSLWLDLVILLRTVPAVLFRRGAH